MSHPTYKNGDVVWVKYGYCWWPGEVWSEDRLPDDMAPPKKGLVACVKYLQEDQFDFIYSHAKIMMYNCDKKDEFLQKGADKLRGKDKLMLTFPDSVRRAEEMTNGNVNILDNFTTPVKQKAKTSMSKSLNDTPPPAVQKPAGAVSSKLQFTPSPAAPSGPKLVCSMCDFVTDRMNLLMFHMKSHSSTDVRGGSNSSTPVEARKLFSTKSPAKRSATADDSIADDVRKIKESMKPKPAAGRPRSVASREPSKPTPTGRSRAAKKEAALEQEKEAKQEVKVEEKPKPMNELKKELLADWSDDDDVEEKLETVEAPKEAPPQATPEVVGESSRFIRNIPKKQRVSEVYIQPEPVKVEPPTIKPSTKFDEELAKATMLDTIKKPAKANKRKHAEVAEKKKPTDDTDDNLLLATAELLNVTEVPKVENAQLPSTFHKLNDIDKRNLPPKERNKRILRAEQSGESKEVPMKVDNNGTKKEVETAVASPSPNELMLPHKKKQSSRLLTADKPVPARETRSGRQEVDGRARKKRRSSEAPPPDVEMNSHEPVMPASPPKEQSPLRDASDASCDILPLVAASNSISHPRRGLKRRNSKGSNELETTHDEAASEPKKLHKSNSESRTFIATASDTCINSKGELSVGRGDSLVTTQANSVNLVTSQVIITEAIIVSPPIIETVFSPKPQVKISPSPKNALKCAPEKLMEMKKQGLVTTGFDKKNKLTEKGKQIFKEQIKEKTVVEPVEEKAVPEPEERKSSESQIVPVTDVNEPLGEKEETQETIPMDVDESTNNNEVDKEPIVAVAPPAKEPSVEAAVLEPIENGKDGEGEPEVDPNSGGAGLIALSAETFGGPPNCFYLCRQIEDRYEPVDNQILMLDAQNALVPYEGGDMSTDDSLVPTEVVAENLAGYSQLSPNSNIIINTPNGQKIELNHLMVLALQEQADENGIASIEMAGEQLELNINGILEAISAEHQQESNENEALMIGGDSALILDTVDLAIETHHSATQVSETLSKPIMSTTVAPEISSTKVTIVDSVKNLNIEDSLATIGVTPLATRSNVLKSLELPITITNPVIAETVNHRKLANAPMLGDLIDVPVVADGFVLQSADNGSED